MWGEGGVKAVAMGSRGCPNLYRTRLKQRMFQYSKLVHLTECSETESRTKAVSLVGVW